MIEFKNIRKEFAESTPLKDINGVINDGEVVSIIGPSGTGKSTLLRCINRLETPTSGHVYVDGVDMTDPKTDLNKMRQKMGLVFQSFNLYENMTVIENVMYGQIHLLKRSKQEAYDYALKLLDKVGMRNQAFKYSSQLSGGQRQRAAIARTLSMDPEIILMDEPTSALDPITVSEVEDVIKN